MNKLISFAVKVAGILVISTLIVKPVSGQSKPIPEDVMKIVQKSCVNCHAEPARGMSISMVNLSKWATMSPSKQADKAKKMCNMVTKDKMPPKKFRESHPNGTPSKEEIATICNWAESLQVAKK
jgi:hypothetical protein